MVKVFGSQVTVVRHDVSVGKKEYRQDIVRESNSVIVCAKKLGN